MFATNGKKGIFYCKKQIIRISLLKLLLATVTKKKKILKLSKLISSQNVLKLQLKEQHKVVVLSQKLSGNVVVILDERFIQVSNLMLGEPLVKVYVII